MCKNDGTWCPSVTVCVLPVRIVVCIIKTHANDVTGPSKAYISHSVYVCVLFSQLALLFSHIDAASLVQLAQSSLTVLASHWAAAMRVLESRTPARRVQISSLVLVDSLLSWYEFGRIRSTVEFSADRVPVARFGVATADLTASDVEYTIANAVSCICLFQNSIIV